MRHPVPTRGALAIVMNAGRDAVDVGCFLDERSWPADGKAVWSWHPDAGVKLSGRKSSWRWWLTSPAHQGDHGEAVKTIAQGMPGQSGEPVATMLVCSLTTSHTRLRVHWASGIPCALVFEWRKIPAKPGRIAPRERGSVSHCRHCAERLARSACDEAIQKCYCGSNLDCFAEPVIGRDFAHYDDVW
jgi:hypothetical protein